MKPTLEVRCPCRISSIVSPNQHRGKVHLRPSAIPALLQSSESGVSSSGTSFQGTLDAGTLMYLMGSSGSSLEARHLAKTRRTRQRERGWDERTQLPPLKAAQSLRRPFPAS